jgi:hypothetical protein
MQEVKNSQLEERRMRIPAVRRKLHAVIFIDFQKAFDRVDRSLLIRKLQAKNVNAFTVQAITALLNNTHGIIDLQEVQTLAGVPQGGVMSPSMFNMYIDDLLTELASTQ